jgi:hypothetical protein
VRNFCPARNLLYLQGAGTGRAEVALYETGGETGAPLQSVTLPDLPPGSAAPVTFTWTAPQRPGVVSLRIVADPEDILRERDERNTATFDVVVSQ